MLMTSVCYPFFGILMSLYWPWARLQCTFWYMITGTKLLVAVAAPVLICRLLKPLLIDITSLFFPYETCSSSRNPNSRVLSQAQHSGFISEIPPSGISGIRLNLGTFRVQWTLSAAESSVVICRCKPQSELGEALYQYKYQVLV